MIDRADRHIALTRSEVHVWFAQPETIRDRTLLLAYGDMLSDTEKERHARFWFERDRHLFLVARALLRSALSRYADVSPEMWQFETNAHGRPEIVPEQRVLPLRFNLSHTHGLVAVAITLEDDIGVDVEHTQRKRDPLPLATRFFSDSEARALHALAAQHQTGRFFDFWTLKEAYIKARGLGLALPLSAFSFEIENARVHIAFDERIVDVPDDWSFVLLRPSSTHRAAVAHRNRSSSVLFGECVPLRSAQRIRPELLATR